MAFYQLSKNAALEVFDDGGLVFVLPDRRLVELNPVAVEILGLLDGRNVLEDVAVEIAKKHGILLQQATQDVAELCKELEQAGVIEMQLDFQSQKKTDIKTTFSSQLLRNPDVVLRVEDPDDGATLFNPDTNKVKVINITGLFIWQQCREICTLNEIVSKVQKEFDEIPLIAVTQDVQEFVDSMVVGGFIGTVEALEIYHE